MSFCKQNLQLFFILICALLISSQAHAKPRYLFKLATIAPEGSIWIKRFRDFAEEVTEKSKGEIGFKIYPGGIMGDDRAMYRKMQIGQLHGGGFTMTGIGRIAGDFRVMSLPFLFRSYEEVDHVKQELWPLFSKSFVDKGLELIAMTEVGFVYSMSISPVPTLGKLKQSKVWAPDGDPISIAYLQTIGITPLPLAVPDVLTSLQTGMVDTVFNSMYGAIVLQWFTKTKYITDIPFGYAYGGLLLDRKKFVKMPDTYQSMIKKTAEKHFRQLITDTRKSNDDSRKVLQDNGVSMVTPDQEDVEIMRKMSKETAKRMQGTAFSQEIYQETIRLLDDFRSQAK
ncbi:MAG: TRAP transporter substrate-binding protein DctP [Thermodesulfobacteriota bacterium]|nr:TRAP transporter substrate-binding protein DctP [Thermodesulfobacteriota bacterium]